MNVSVCLFTRISQKPQCPNFTKFSVHVHCGRGSVASDDVMYFPVLWITLCLPVIGQAKAMPIGRMLRVTHSGRNWGRRLMSTIALLHFASRRRRKIYCGHARLCVCLCVCLSAAACPHYCTDPDVTWGSGRGCPLVVHYWADSQSVHGLRCYGNITRTLVTSLSPSRAMTT